MEASRKHEVITEQGAVPLLLDEPSSAPAGTVVFAHGAGGGMRSEFMATIASGVAGRGWRVVRFDFPYMAAGRKAPDKAPVLEGSFRAVLEEVRIPGAPLVAGGKSMGGRIASHLAADTDLSGLVFLGYPLHPPGRPDRIRDAHLYEIDIPMLFVEGTRDPFCPLRTLERVRQKIPSSELVVIEDGDHSFKVRKSSGRSTAEAWAEVADRVSGWLDLSVVSVP